MGKNSGIDWTDHTWNPWQGCAKVSPGCLNCYMYREKARYGQDPREVVRSSPYTFNSPRRWKDPARVFVCSWSDFFIEEADEWRPEAWDIIRQAPHTFQILTKRTTRAKLDGRLFPADWGSGWPHVGVGVSVEGRSQIWRIEDLQQVPTAWRWVSAEPLLGPLDLRSFLTGENALQWVVAGGESGPQFRPAELDWFRDLRDQCQAAAVPFFLKQLGGNRKVDGCRGGHVLDGQVYQEFP